MVEITVYAPVAVQIPHCLFHVGNRVQYEAVSLFQSERGSRKKVHEAFKNAAHVSRRAFRLDQRHIFRRHASEAHNFIVVVEDNFKNSYELEFNFNNRNVKDDIQTVIPIGNYKPLPR